MDALGQEAVPPGRKGRSGKLDATPDRESLRRRHYVAGMIAMVLALVVTMVVAVRLADQVDQPSSAPAVEPTAPVTTISAPVTTISTPITPQPIPPPRPLPAVLADPSPSPSEFPMSIEIYNEGVGARLSHRSGGPYLTEGDVRQRALDLTRCEQANARCDGAVVRFFASYASAYQAYGASSWPYIGGFGHDREVYLVTVYGALPFCPRAAIIGPSPCPIYRDHSNLVIDATTGEPT